MLNMNDRELQRTKFVQHTLRVRCRLFNPNKGHVSTREVIVLQIDQYQTNIIHCIPYVQRPQVRL